MYHVTKNIAKAFLNWIVVDTSVILKYIHDLLTKQLDDDDHVMTKRAKGNKFLS